uniref:Tubulin epsilon and delta complex 1 n=1 Tax=Meleagris gallopavo TaxID=9103 RepID=A0A803YHY9_MELGA
MYTSGRVNLGRMERLETYGVTPSHAVEREKPAGDKLCFESQRTSVIKPVLSVSLSCSCLQCWWLSARLVPAVLAGAVLPALGQLLQHLELETMQLEAFLEWKQLEAVYWQWMETVLDNMAEEGSMHSMQDAPVETSRLQEGATCCPWAESTTAQIDRLSAEMTALQSQLNKLVARRRSAWCQKVKAREEELQKEDFSAKLGKIEESVELKLLDLMNHGAPNRTKMHGSCRLVFRSKHSASKTGFGGSVSEEPVPAVSATEVIRELRMREASLQRELKQLRDECKQRLDGVAERLDGVICISP